MAKKKLGKKYVCYQCGCKFYDLSRSKPLCPKCGADQNEAPAKEATAPPKAGGITSAPSRLRGRRRRVDQDSTEPAEDFSDDELETDEALEDGLTMIDDEELVGTGSEDYSEED